MTHPIHPRDQQYEWFDRGFRDGLLGKEMPSFAAIAIGKNRQQYRLGHQAGSAQLERLAKIDLPGSEDQGE